MLLMLDNYDSFTYNLVQYFGELGVDPQVYRNDSLSVEDVKNLNPSKIVISPGPGRPQGAGISVDLIKELAGKIPILGVCLGHQSIAYAYGAKIIRAQKIMHGKTSQIKHNGKEIYQNVDSPFEATRYHSLVIDPKTLPKCFEVTARSEDKEIMSIRHKKLPLWGVQYHPESILTVAGKQILDNFLKL